MASPENPDEPDEYNEFKDLCYHIGLALVVWQEVERALFVLFIKMLGSSYNEMASVVFYGIESFEARRKMVGNMAHYFLKEKADKAIWNDNTGGLQKALKDGNEKRNKLAHYDLEEDFVDITYEQDGSAVVNFGPPRLRPTQYNLISTMRGHTPDKPEHNLSVKEVIGYIKEFHDLAEQVNNFTGRLPSPPSEFSGPA